MTDIEKEHKTAGSNTEKPSTLRGRVEDHIDRDRHREEKPSTLRGRVEYHIDRDRHREATEREREE